MKFLSLSVAGLCLTSWISASPVFDDVKTPLLCAAPIPSPSSTTLTIVTRSERSTSLIPSNPLSKRTSIEEKLAIINVAFFTVATIAGVAAFLTQVIKTQSDQNSCAVVSGNADSLSYQYYAATTGSNCDTTAEDKTINAAVTKIVQWMIKYNVDDVCVIMNHSGTWNGYLQLAGNNRAIIPGKCSESLNYADI